MVLLIRDAVPADYLVMDAIFRSATEVLCRGAYSEAVIAALTAVPKPERYVRDAEQGAQYIVVCDDGRVLGYGSINLGQSRVQAMFVDPDFSGRGLGKRLMAYLCERARDAGLSRLIVSASLNAEGFYAAQGFIASDRRIVRIGDGLELEAVIMARVLAVAL